MYWGPDYGTKNIGCEFGKDKLKTLLCRVHTVKKAKLASWWPQISQIGDKNGLGSRSWSNVFGVNLKMD